MENYINDAVEKFRTLLEEQLARENEMEKGGKATDFAKAEKNNYRRVRRRRHRPHYCERSKTPCGSAASKRDCKRRNRAARNRRADN